MAIDDIRQGRLKKLKSIESAGLLPYPVETRRTHTCCEALSNFSKLAKDRKSTRLNSSHVTTSRMPSSA